MDPTIRSATREDCAQLTELMHASSAYRGDYAAILHGYAVTPAQVEADLVFVAEQDGRILGFYSLRGVPAAPELDLLFVRDEAQGRCLGARLLDHLRGQARALGIARIAIVAHPPAEAFYLRMGAERVGTRPPTGRVSWSRPLLSLPVG